MGFVPVLIGFLDCQWQCKTMEEQAAPPRVRLWLSCAFIISSVNTTGLDRRTEATPGTAGSTESLCLLCAGTQEFLLSVWSWPELWDVLSGAKPESVHAHSSSGAGRASSGQSTRRMSLQGRKKLLHTCPVWDLCSWCRAAVRLFHLSSSPISIPTMSVTSPEIQNKTQALKIPRGRGFCSGQNLGCFSWVAAVTWVGQTELLQML